MVVVPEMNICVAHTTKELRHVYSMLKYARAYYPDFQRWYWQKVIHGIQTGKRTILLAYNLKNRDIMGVSIIKDDGEKKICTFFVKEDYRFNGVGTVLMKTSLEYLQCAFPLFTVPEDLDKDFAILTKKFHFKSKRIYSDYYRPGKKERAYNGYLVDECPRIVVRIAA